MTLQSKCGRRQKFAELTPVHPRFGAPIAHNLKVNAKAFPAPAALRATASNIVEVRGFCGPGFHRAPYGACIAKGVFLAGNAVPVLVAPRVVCPYGYYYNVPYGRCVPTP
jgi:hypothetical protein